MGGCDSSVVEQFVPVYCRLSGAALDDCVSIEKEANPAPWSQKLFAEEFNNDYSVTYGVRIVGQLAGFIVCHAIIDEAHVMNFGLRSALRGRGLGKGLLTHALVELNAKGIRWITLEVRRSNDVARGLYESLGFQEAGVRSKYYSDNLEDAIVMTLSLPQFMQEHGKQSE